MEERVIVYGSHGYMEWAYWVDSVIHNEHLRLVIVKNGNPQLLNSNPDVRVVSNEVHAQQVIDADRRLYDTQSRVQHERFMRENFPSV